MVRIFNPFAHIQIDFEKASRNTFRNIFGVEIVFTGWFFHYGSLPVRRLKRRSLLVLN